MILWLSMGAIYWTIVHSITIVNHSAFKNIREIKEYKDDEKISPSYRYVRDKGGKNAYVGLGPTYKATCSLAHDKCYTPRIYTCQGLKAPCNCAPWYVFDTHPSLWGLQCSSYVMCSTRSTSFAWKFLQSMCPIWIHSSMQTSKQPHIVKMILNTSRISGDEAKWCHIPNMNRKVIERVLLKLKLHRCVALIGS